MGGCLALVTDSRRSSFVTYNFLNTRKSNEQTIIILRMKIIIIQLIYKISEYMWEVKLIAKQKICLRKCSWSRGSGYKNPPGPKNVKTPMECGIACSKHHKSRNLKRSFFSLYENPKCGNGRNGCPCECAWNDGDDSKSEYPGSSCCLTKDNRANVYEYFGPGFEPGILTYFW